MQYFGIIENWDDERGFGFVMPDGTDPRTFVHAKKFADRQRRPVDGDPIVFNLALDEQNRPQAVNIHFGFGDAVPRRDQSRTQAGSIGFRGLIGIAFLGMLVALYAMEKIPVAVPLFYAAISIVAIIVYAQDKFAALEKRWRTSERKLQMLAFFGGWPGALLGQNLFRHKTGKQSFQTVFWIAVVMNCGLLATFLAIKNPDASSTIFAWINSTIETFQQYLSDAQPDNSRPDDSPFPITPR